MVSESQAAQAFSRTLLGLKQKSGCGYRELVKSLYVSTAALHRYCVGRALPPDFGLVRRFARQHGMHNREITLLYRQWLQAQLDLTQTWP